MPSVKELNQQAAAAYAAVPGRYWIESLKDGRHVLIRPLTERDREREYAFVKCHAPDASHMRLLTPVYPPGAPVPSQYNRKRMAFAALIHEHGNLIEMGISRYVISGDRACECTVTVAEEWRHLGLGSLLMKHLIQTARKNGFRQMNASADSDNAAMQHLARHLGFTTDYDPEDHHRLIHQLHLHL